MKTLTLVALGALALTGCDFVNGGDVDGVALPVASIQASGLSSTFDADSAPDVFVEIQNAAGQTMWRSTTQTDADVAQGISVTVPEAVEVAAATQGVMIAVWDFDTSYTDSQIMARSQPFTADQLAAQPELQLTAGVGSGTFTVRSRAAQ